MNRATAPGYDLFKLVVTLVLSAMVVILLLRGCGSAPVAPQPAATQANLLNQATLPPSPTPAPATATASPLPPSTMTQAPSTPTAVPTTAAAATETPSPTAEPPVATPAPTTEPTSAATAAAPANAECPGAAVSRIKTGVKVRVLTNLNMRRDPGLNGAWILTNPIGTELEIIGGPGCTSSGQQAYQWWQVRRADGQEGWSAEASLHGQYYFLELIP